MLKPGSSPVDWCESNYLYSPFIAEYVNTFSNVLFFALPPILMWLFRPYGQVFNQGVHIIWGMLIVVGICSAYFHATLSLLGQLLDELAILWVVATAFALWFPARYLPNYFRRKRYAFQCLILSAAVVSSGLALVQPAMNAFVLMILGLPALYLMISELNRCTNSRVLRLGARCGSIWILAVFCWVNDRMFCDTWSYLNFPYLHAIWHILIFIAAYTACVLFAFFDAENKIPEKNPELKFWPSDNYEFLGVPYVGLSGISWEMDHVIKKQHLI
ncbi:alkaline ceramidase [Folsomia candida]|uniref:alkaline ceramidase n=1 Tax=Folsomia candida TaxID=158441 RepID=UPI000B8F45C6|nr:alkaline ceramidase [Folsomia candida]XP_021954229.1 alkaline ceramidase [Folsomia candida]XP_021954237.1 alkaline ceramidase [Folsomia candida]XP_035702836.1 alkaline ceramidase [Folsomia candida]